MQMPVSSQLHQWYKYMSNFWICVNLIGEKWKLSLVLICISVKNSMILYMFQGPFVFLFLGIIYLHLSVIFLFLFVFCFALISRTFSYIKVISFCLC